MSGYGLNASRDDPRPQVGKSKFYQHYQKCSALLQVVEWFKHIKGKLTAHCCHVLAFIGRSQEFFNKHKICSFFSFNIIKTAHIFCNACKIINVYLFVTRETL